MEWDRESKDLHVIGHIPVVSHYVFMIDTQCMADGYIPAAPMNHEIAQGLPWKHRNMVAGLTGEFL